MRRSVLLTFLALGVVVTMLGGTGLFAALSDTSRTGTNSATSPALSGSADLQLATATFSGGAVTCGSFAENLTSGLFTVTNSAPGSAHQSFFCLKNLGSQTVTVSALVEELADIDTACTGDEAASGDATCGGNLQGELSDALTGNYSIASCTTGPGAPVLSGTPKLSALASTPGPLGTLAAGGIGCYQAVISYPLSTPAATVQKAQSDQVTWRYAFTGQA